METFLQLCRSNLSNLSQFKHVSIIIGNESCDLDSAVSSIVLAYVKYHEALNKLLNSKSDNDDSSIIVFPVLNVPRDDLNLRREIVFWFEQVLQFDLKSLICRDEVDYEQLNSSAQITITLVDHNENKEFARLLPRGHFEEIIDHHQPTYQDGSCQVADQSKLLIDTSVGSCCSLVALRFLDCNLVSKFTKKEISADSQIALLLYGPILLDTICFNHAAKRFNVKDYEAVNKLEDLLKHTADAESSLFDRNDVYQRLVEAKNSLDGLTFNELLRKDTKIVESISDNNLAICISAITGTKLTELALKDNLNELKSFCNEPPSSAVFSDSRQRLFNALVLLSMDNRIPNNLQRQLALYCANKHLMRTIATCIERNSELELELITASESLRIYNQNNLTATRKMVLPIISTILNGPGTQRPNDENAKRSESVGSDSMLSHPSAPNSLIQQPDSYYGSYIEDSFVGDFVGEYMDPINDHNHENILVMDADGQNLVMMNPNDTISHSHEMEFDFDSFGPESIIYAGNVEAIDSKTNGNSEEANSHEKTIEEDKLSHNDLEESASSLVKVDAMLPTLSEEKSYSDDTLSSKITNSESETKPNADLNDLKSAELISDSGNSSISNSSPVNSEAIVSGYNFEEKKPNHENVIELKFEEVNGKKDLDEGELNAQSISSLPINALSSFSRNNTLTRSQRKKVHPQVNIKNLIMASNTYSPPVLDSSLIPSLQLVDSNQQLANQLNGDKKIDQNENFIISSQNYSETHEPQPNIDHPLSISTSSHNLANENILNPNGLGGLTRQPSMKKKVPVNYDMLLHNNYDKDEEAEKLSNSKQLDNINEELKQSNDIGGKALLNSEHTSSGINALQPEQEEEDRSFYMGNGESRSIDMKVIEPYKKVISHGGYMHSSADGRNIEGSSPAIIIFSACYMPDRSRKDYAYVMDNLFMYVLTTLHNMIADDYILIYLHNGGMNNYGNNMPTFGWLKRCYQMIDRKLKKNLKGLYILHPTFWLKTLIIMSRPFISSKFSRKLKFVRSLEELRSMIPIEHVAIPEPVKM